MSRLKVWNESLGEWEYSGLAGPLGDAAPGTQYTEDDAITANAGTGNLVIARRDDALSTLTPVADDAVGLRVGDKGALWVQISDGSGNQITSFGGTQYVSDAVATATPTGTIDMGLASAAAPAGVSADSDAVALWALRNGSQVVNLASGGTLITIGGKTAAASLPVVLPTDGYGSGGAAAMHVVLGTGAADYTLFGQAAATAPFMRITDATTNVGVIVATTALKTDFSSIAGTAPVSAGIAGVLAVAGGVAQDAAVGAQNPLYVGVKGSTAVPTAMTTDGDLTALWATLNGSLHVTLTDSTGAMEPAYGAPADGDSNAQTINTIEAYGAVFNGTTWDRARSGGVTGMAGVSGDTVHDAADAGNPLKTGGYAKAAAPTDVSADGDRVNAWFLRNGAQASVITAAGALVGGSAAGLYAQGPSAADAAVSGNPILNGARASTAVPTAMSADGDAVSLWANRSGAQVVATAPHTALVGSPWTLTSKTAQYTSTQTSADLIAAVAATTIVVTSIQIQAGGTTAGALQVYFGTGAYSRGTSKAVFDGEFAPSATLKPGVTMPGPFISASADALKVTTSAAINPITVTVWYYVVT